MPSSWFVALVSDLSNQPHFCVREKNWHHWKKNEGGGSHNIALNQIFFASEDSSFKSIWVGAKTIESKSDEFGFYTSQLWKPKSLEYANRLFELQFFRMLCASHVPFFLALFSLVVVNFCLGRCQCCHWSASNAMATNANIPDENWTTTTTTTKNIVIVYLNGSWNNEIN